LRHLGGTETPDVDGRLHCGHWLFEAARTRVGEREAETAKAGVQQNVNGSISGLVETPAKLGSRIAHIETRECF